MPGRDLLLIAGFIEKVAVFRYTWKGPSPAQYRLSQPLAAEAKKRCKFRPPDLAGYIKARKWTLDPVKNKKKSENVCYIPIYH